jgi:transposase
VTTEERNRELEKENAELRAKLAERDRKIAEQEERLRRLEEKLRRFHKQAAPFARRKRKAAPKKAGRPKGHVGAHQPVPSHVDEEIRVPLTACPCCGRGDVQDVRDLEQFVIDLPVVRPYVWRLVLQSGYCVGCAKRVRTTHPLQVSSATGAAKVSLGPRAMGFAGELHHRLGVPYRDVADVFGAYFGLRVTHSALVHGSVRLAARGDPTFQALKQIVRRSPVVHTDDTGWRINAESAWLWVFATPKVTVYDVATGRGSDVVTAMLGDDFDGILVSDGLPALDALDKLGWVRAQCLGHLVRRAAEMEIEQSARTRWFPRAIKGLLKDAIALAKRQGDVAWPTHLRKVRAIEKRTDQLLQAPLRQADNRRLQKHLLNHRWQLFYCLIDPAVPTTNNLAEQELRPAVIIRKTGACNRSARHAQAHAALASVAQTAHRNGLTLADFVIDWMQPARASNALHFIAPSAPSATLPN